jgi:hypothetical protein
VSWLLSACHHLDGNGTCWVADCLAPGCLWSVTTDDPETTDYAADDHTRRDHEPDQLDGEEDA